MRFQNICLLAIILMVLMSCNSHIKTSEFSLTKMDCMIFEEKTGIENLVNGTIISDSYKTLQDKNSNGYQVLFFYKVLGRRSYKKALYLTFTSLEDFSIYDIQENITINPEDTQLKEKIKNLVIKVEQGSYRQACNTSRSGGSFEGCVIKRGDEVVFEYESPQFGHNYLPMEESEKIKGGVSLFNFFIDLDITDLK